MLYIMADYVQSVMDPLKYTFINPAEESSSISLSSDIIPTEAIRKMHMKKDNLICVLSLIFVW